jgi:hypothetical protein
MALNTEKRAPEHEKRGLLNKKPAERSNHAAALGILTFKIAERNVSEFTV